MEFSRIEKREENVTGPLELGKLWEYFHVHGKCHSRFSWENNFIFVHRNDCWRLIVSRFLLIFTHKTDHFISSFFKMYFLFTITTIYACLLHTLYLAFQLKREHIQLKTVVPFENCLKLTLTLVQEIKSCREVFEEIWNSIHSGKHFTARMFLHYKINTWRINQTRWT